MKVCIWCGQQMLSTAQDFCGSQCNVNYTAVTTGMRSLVPPPGSPLLNSLNKSRWPGQAFDPSDDDDLDSDPPDEYSLYIEKMEDGVTSE